VEEKRKGIHWGCLALPYFVVVFAVGWVIFGPRNGFFFLFLVGALVVWFFLGTWLERRGWLDPGPPVPPPFS